MTDLTKTIIEAIQDKKAKNIVSIDMSKFEGAICDTFVICNADSTTQVSAIADGVEDKVFTTLNERVWRTEGKDNGVWIVMDFGDVMVHIFQTESREFYALDQLWSDLPIKHYDSFD
ncbi:MAG: ribosome silencing factor [Rikenellaceae bacterium]